MFQDSCMWKTKDVWKRPEIVKLCSIQALRCCSVAKLESLKGPLGTLWHCCSHHLFLSTPVWTDQGSLRQMVLVITEADTQEVLERWTFDIDTNKEVLAGGWVAKVVGFLQIISLSTWKTCFSKIQSFRTPLALCKMIARLFWDVMLHCQVLQENKWKGQ